VVLNQANRDAETWRSPAPQVEPTEVNICQSEESLEHTRAVIDGECAESAGLLASD